MITFSLQFCFPSENMLFIANQNSSGKITVTVPNDS